MPELPEVETTANDLKELVVGLKIKDVWTNYNSPYYKGKKQIKNPVFFKKFKKEIVGSKIIDTSRRAKNVLIHLDKGKTILVHMKMTGHLIFGKYENKKTKDPVWQNEPWIPKDLTSVLADPFNRWIRLVITFTNGKHLVLSDMRKFAKVTLLDTEALEESEDLEKLGPEILESKFKFKNFIERINKKPNGHIKTVLMDQELIVGVGNIYSDESLWMTKIHPETKVSKIKESKLKELFKNVKDILRKGINFKGDSMSDYRRPSGEPGNFQKYHMVYQRKKEVCKRKTCEGVIERIVVNGRSSHFCPECQRK